MKNLLNKARDGLNNMSTRCKKEALAFTAVAGATMPTFVMAADSKTLMKNIVKVITKIFGYIGVLLLAWSVGMLILAFKNEDADSKSRAMMLLVVSIVLIGIDGFFTTVGIDGVIDNLG